VEVEEGRRDHWVSFPFRRKDGEGVSSAGFTVGLGSGAGGEIAVAMSSDGSIGGVFKPGVGTDGGASTFKGSRVEGLPVYVAREWGKVTMFLRVHLREIGAFIAHSEGSRTLASSGADKDERGIS